MTGMNPYHASTRPLHPRIDRRDARGADGVDHRARPRPSRCPPRGCSGCRWSPSPPQRSPGAVGLLGMAAFRRECRAMAGTRRRDEIGVEAFAGPMHRNRISGRWGRRSTDSSSISAPFSPTAAIKAKEMEIRLKVGDRRTAARRIDHPRHQRRGAGHRQLRRTGPRQRLCGGGVRVRPGEVLPRPGLHRTPRPETAGPHPRHAARPRPVGAARARAHRAGAPGGGPHVQGHALVLRRPGPRRRRFGLPPSPPPKVWPIPAARRVSSRCCTT